MTRESLRKLNVQELENQLSIQKENLQNLSSTLNAARQAQILRTKTIRGNAKKRKEELIRQILQLQKEAGKVQAKINAIQVRNEMNTQKKAGKVQVKIKEIQVINEMNTHLAVNYEGTHERLDFDKDDGYIYKELIAKYEDYVKAGIIKRQNSLNKYEAADWFADNYMSEDDMKRAIEVADDRREKAAMREATKNAERRARIYIDF